MLGQNQHVGKQANPWGGPIGCFAVMIAAAVSFLFVPYLHGATVDWALEYIKGEYGSWMVWVGWYVWWFLVAALTFLTVNLLVIMVIKAIQFGVPLLLSRFF